MSTWQIILIVIGAWLILKFQKAHNYRRGYVDGYFSGRSDQMHVETLRLEHWDKEEQFDRREADQVVAQQIEQNYLLAGTPWTPWDGVDRLSFYG